MLSEEHERILLSILQHKHLRSTSFTVKLPTNAATCSFSNYYVYAYMLLYMCTLKVGLVPKHLFLCTSNP